MITSIVVAIVTAVLGYYIANYFANRVLESVNQQVVDTMLPQVIVTSALIKARTTPPEPKTVVTEVQRPKTQDELLFMREYIERERDEAFEKHSDCVETGWEMHLQSTSEDPDDPVFPSMQQLNADICDAYERHIDRLNEALAKFSQHDA